MTNKRSDQYFEPNKDLAQVFRAESGRIIAILTAQCHDLQLSEDALQDACLQATERWHRSPPKNPSAWLLTAARRRLIDRLRKSTKTTDEQTLRHILNCDKFSGHARSESVSEADAHIPDERLKLIFTCCHPALNQQAQVALTLKTVCGLSVKEIARAYLVSEAAMSQRLLRTKNKIRSSGIVYQLPDSEHLTNRLESVLSTIYLIYNESYSAFEGQALTRDDLANESIRLARILYALLPMPEVGGLLALMLLHQSRKTSRSAPDESFIPLALQDRSGWDQQKISEGRSLLLQCLNQARPGKYQLQAAISALHSEAETWLETDWQQIRLLYAELYKKMPSPVVKLNSLVAIAYSGEPEQALTGLESIADELIAYPLFYVAQADIFAKLENIHRAKASYLKAINITHNQIEKAYLETQLDKLENIEP